MERVTQRTRFKRAAGGGSAAADLCEKRSGAGGRKQISVIRTVRMRSVNVVRVNCHVVVNMGGTAEV